MDFITEFYKGLETLDLIIFWGIIIVIILLLVFFAIMISKNKKNKRNNIEDNEGKKEISFTEEIPIKNSITLPDNLNKENSNINKNFIIKENDKEEKEEKTNILDNQIETEKNFIAEEHIMEFNNNQILTKKEEKELETKSNNNMNNDIKTKENNSINYKKKIEMPTGPYQRNVLREMSLGQTSPIGITAPKRKNENQLELAKELEQSLNEDTTEEYNTPKEINKENIIVVNEPFIKQQLINESLKIKNSKDIETKTQNIPKKELRIERHLNNDINSNINRNNIDPRVKKILDSSPKDINIEEKLEEKQHLNKEAENLTSIDSKVTRKTEFISKSETKIKNNEQTINYNNVAKETKELLNSVKKSVFEEKEKSSSEKYLEEVSRKLAEAEISDEVERTDYELEQEENAIISYKELMEKKDSIQTIDEEEAIISIEELMNRNKTNDETKKENNESFKENDKLYNLNEEEENEDFIKELKQFRNDL